MNSLCIFWHILINFNGLYGIDSCTCKLFTKLQNLQKLHKDITKTYIVLSLFYHVINILVSAFYSHMAQRSATF